MAPSTFCIESETFSQHPHTAYHSHARSGLRGRLHIPDVLAHISKNKSFLVAQGFNPSTW